MQGDDLSQHYCQAVVLLMGCSSAKLKAEGHLDATGVMLKYLLAGWSVIELSCLQLPLVFTHPLSNFIKAISGRTIRMGKME